MIERMYIITGILWTVTCVTEIISGEMPIRGILAEGTVAYICFLKAFSI